MRPEQKFSVRHSTLSDYPTIKHLWKSTGLTTMFDRRVLYMAVMRKTPDLFLVAEFEGKIVGAVVAFKRLKMGYVHHLAVHPKYQRQKIGSKLLEQICKKLSFRKARFAFLVADVKANERHRLIKFYTRHGFRRIMEESLLKNSKLFMFK